MDLDAAVVTPVQSQEYEEGILERLWNGTISKQEWSAFATKELPLGIDAPQDASMLRFETMMVQDIRNPEYFLGNGDATWSERLPIHLIPYPSSSVKPSCHRDKRFKTASEEILGYFYHDSYPCEVGNKQLKINELVDVVAIRASSQSIFDSTDTDEEIQNCDSSEQGWHILWFRRRSLYDGINGYGSEEKSKCSSLGYQALMLLLYSRTERDSTGKAVVTPNGSLLGCANLRWIVQNELERDALLRVLPAPFTILTHEDFGMLTPRRNASTGRLGKSPFQLPAGALLVVDLCGIDNGTFDMVDSVLKTVIETHRLEYLFEGGMRIPFEADYRILIIVKSSTVCDKLSAENTFAIRAEPDFTENCPTMLPRVSDHVTLPSALLESVVEAYASLEAVDKSEDVLHRWLIATRSIARCNGRATATCADWEKAYQLERKLRRSLENTVS